MNEQKGKYQRDRDDANVEVEEPRRVIIGIMYDQMMGTSLHKIYLGRYAGTKERVS